jgi:calcineurin-like phosphoesterase family protein
MIHFTSDPHYMHKNISGPKVSSWKSGYRDFENEEEMSKQIVKTWNQHVKHDDILYCLGDWSFGGFEKIEEFRSQINCKNIILMIGNHDHHIEKNKDDIRKLFTHVAHYEEIDIKTVGKFVICHYPIISWNGLHKGVYMLHGHQHLNEEQKIGEGRRIDVGVDGSSEFRPYHINEIVDILAPRFSKK